MEPQHVGYDDTRFTSDIDPDLHCAICLNVLKEPVQCQTNEHHFCAPCIKRHLENFQTCPSCMEQLTVDTLKKPSRFLVRNLSELVIRCEFVDRGCDKVMPLSNLKTHSANCEYSPVRCSNEGCNEVINKSEVMRHESQACKFRKLKCDDCRETRKDIDEIKWRLGVLQGQMSQVLAEISNLSGVNPIYALQENSSPIGDIIVVGGRGTTSRLNSAEKFSWSSGSWTRLQPMRQQRSGASSAVYEDKVIVTGGISDEAGYNNDVEALHFDGKVGNWIGIPPKLPNKTTAHKSIVYKDRLLFIGGRNEEISFDSIYEISFISPYSSERVCCMPQPTCYHGAERFGNNIYIVGGSLFTGSDTTTDIVMRYSIHSKECISMPRLPFPVRRMATVTWKNNVILIGGTGRTGKTLDTVVMYDIETGKSKMLPNMKYKRNACTAVAVQHKIVVMGGTGEDSSFLDTVESFGFDDYCWKELPPMTECRSYATAVVKCPNFS